MSKNKNLQEAKRAKNDEFYTMYEDIEKELEHYIKHFGGKVVYCNCDSTESNFWKYFVNNFERLKLKKLVCTYYNTNGSSFKTEYVEQPYNNNENKIYYSIVKTPLFSNGDFHSQECINILKEADIVVTNPPFSLFREYVKQLVDYNKKFLIIGNDNAITYKDFFPLLKDNKVWKGVTHPKEFIQPDKSTKKFGNISWFTNLEHSKRYDFIPLTKGYSPEQYPKYDNYDAINVNKTKDIPCDYFGVIGVPISFLDKYSPEQFEIVGLGSGWNGKNKSVIKTYPKKQIQHNKNKEDSIVGKLNDGTPCFSHSALPDNKTYYTFGDDKYYTRAYCRILIKRKEKQND